MKYISCIDEKMKEKLIKIGFNLLFEMNGIWYFEFNNDLKLPNHKSIKIINHLPM